jgi:hypothetical protein
MFGSQNPLAHVGAQAIDATEFFALCHHELASRIQCKMITKKLMFSAGKRSTIGAAECTAREGGCIMQYGLAQNFFAREWISTDETHSSPLIDVVMVIPVPDVFDGFDHGVLCVSATETQ